jgi:hypothetical protein
MSALTSGRHFRSPEPATLTPGAPFAAARQNERGLRRACASRAARLRPLPHSRRRSRTCRHQSRRGTLPTHAARRGRGVHPQHGARARSAPVVKRGARRLALGPRNELVGRQRSHTCLFRGRRCRRRLVERPPRAPLRHRLTACAGARPRKPARESGCVSAEELTIDNR